MTSRFTGAAGFALLALAKASLSHAALYYVNPDSGNDTKHAGTNATAPWKTLAKARDALEPGDTLHLASAKTFTEALVLSTGVSYTTYGGSEPARISGLRRVDIASTTWTKDAAYPIYTTKLARDVAPTGVSQVFMGGDRLIRARTPNAGRGDFKSVSSSQFARVTADGDHLTLNLNPKIVPAGEEVRGATAMIRLRGSDLGEYDVADWKPGSFSSLAVKAVSFTEDWYIAHEYTIPAGHGYWLENKRWMLDSAREWHYDAGTRELSLWAPNGLSPQGQNVTIATMPNGIVGKAVGNVTVNNILVMDTASDGISLVASRNVTLSQVTVLRAGRRGIAMAGSANCTITGATVDGSAADGIWLGFWSTFTPHMPPAHIRRSVNIDILDSKIINSGLRGYAQAAVRLGEGGRFANNTVQNTPYIGVSAPLNNTIEDNLIVNSCSGYEDCGGIYVLQPPDDPAKLAKASPTTPVTRIKMPNNIVIRHNIVDGGTGSPDGVPEGQGTDTRGIYLDDYVNGVKVQGNYVSGMKHGYMLHTAFNNEVSDNLAIRNRSNNFFMQEHAVPDLNPQNAQNAQKTWANGEMRQNTFARNAMVASRDAASAKRAIPNILHIAHGSGGKTQQFGTYLQNQYATLNPNAANILAYNYGADQKGKEDMSLATWRGIGNDSQGAMRQAVEAYGFYNSSRSSKLTVNCPTTVVANCARFIDLKKNAAVTFPLTLDAWEAVILIR